MKRFIVRWQSIEGFDECLTLEEAARFGWETEQAGMGAVDLIIEVEICEEDGRIHYEALWTYTLHEAIYSAGLDISTGSVLHS